MSTALLIYNQLRASGVTHAGALGLLYALLVFVIVDYVTGVMCAISDRQLSSAVGFKGLCRKTVTFLLVGIAHVLDVHVLEQPGVLRTAVTFWAIANNELSILENAAHLGLPVPEQLKDVLELLHDRSEKTDTSDLKIEEEPNGEGLLRKRTSSGATELLAHVSEANGCGACEDAEQLHDRAEKSGEP